MVDLRTRPLNLTVDRSAGTLAVVWRDGHTSQFPLRWLRANCPCATCREERRAAVLAADELRLTSGPQPSVEIAHAELVGNYAVRFEWSDGHGTGIYAFTNLRASCPCSACHPDGPPPLLDD